MHLAVSSSCSLERANLRTETFGELSSVLAEVVRFLANDTECLLQTALALSRRIYVCKIKHFVSVLGRGLLSSQVLRVQQVVVHAGNFELFTRVGFFNDKVGPDVSGTVLLPAVDGLARIALSYVYLRRAHRVRVEASVGRNWLDSLVASHDLISAGAIQIVLVAVSDIVIFSVFIAFVARVLIADWGGRSRTSRLRSRLDLRLLIVAQLIETLTFLQRTVFVLLLLT